LAAVEAELVEGSRARPAGRPRAVAAAFRAEGRERGADAFEGHVHRPAPRSPDAEVDLAGRKDLGSDRPPALRKRHGVSPDVPSASMARPTPALGAAARDRPPTRPRISRRGGSETAAARSRAG